MKNQREFRLTMIDEASLFARLRRELRFLIYELRLAWTAWKRDPIGFSRHTLLEGWLRLRQTAAPHHGVVGGRCVGWLSRSRRRVLDNDRRETFARLHEAKLDIAIFMTTPNAPKEDQGVGAGTEGRVGLRNAK